MKIIVGLLMTGIVAVWVAAIAILSVQNATAVSLQFLTFQSIQLPVGVLLAFSVSGGMVAMAAVQMVLNVRREGGE